MSHQVLGLSIGDVLNKTQIKGMATFQFSITSVAGATTPALLNGLTALETITPGRAGYITAVRQSLVTAPGAGKTSVANVKIGGTASGTAKNTISETAKAGSTNSLLVPFGATDTIGAENVLTAGGSTSLGAIQVDVVFV